MSRSLLPGPVAAGIRALLDDPRGPLTATSLSGGCINHVVRVDAPGRDPLLVKWNDRCDPGFFAAEADGLRALAGSIPLRVPAVPGLSQDGDGGPEWLALEYVAPGPPGPDYDVQLGEGLAALHLQPAHASFGWPASNYIGALPQFNERHGAWPEFWTTCRLAPLVRRAGEHLSQAELDGFDRLVARIPDLLAVGQVEAPSLLHGDLWSGNVFADADGRPVLIDPAVYVGHREVDLAMTELFGGFGPGFYASYRAKAPLRAGYAPGRREVYQLYPLLVHLVLFGSGYLDGVRRALETALGAD